MIEDITRHLQIWRSVGRGGVNLESDIGHVQVLLRLAGREGRPALNEDGNYTERLELAITAFQREVLGFAPDGLVEPASATFRGLVDSASDKIAECTRLPAASLHRSYLRDADYRQAAAALGCKVEAIKAVSEVESTGAPFLRSGKPKILFEPHVFGALTHYRYNATFPEVSRHGQLSRGHGVHEYGGLEEQWTKLRIASMLDRGAAIQSASWGRFQILGTNWRRTGASSLDAFLNVMFTSEKSQLDGFVAFVKVTHLTDALKHLNWHAFAKGYNGPKYYKQHYDLKIAKKYRELCHHAALARL